MSFLGDLAEGLTTPVGRALTALVLERERRHELWSRIVALMVAPRHRPVEDVLDRAVARGDISPQDQWGRRTSPQWSTRFFSLRLGFIAWIASATTAPSTEPSHAC